jgi:hypothetical protein
VMSLSRLSFGPFVVLITSKSFRVSKFTDTCLLYGSDETYEPAVETGSSMSLNEP